MLGRRQARGPHHPVAESWCRPADEKLPATIVDHDFGSRMNRFGDAGKPSVLARTRDAVGEYDSRKVVEDLLVHAPDCLDDDVAVRLSCTADAQGHSEVRIACTADVTL